LFYSAELVGVEEAIECYVELKPDANDLLYEFSCYIKQNYGAEGFWHVVGGFVRLGYNNQYGSFELGRSSFIFDARVCDGDYFS